MHVAWVRWTRCDFFIHIISFTKTEENSVLALLSQYACCHMGFLIVRIVGNINEFLTGRGRRGCERRTDGQTDRRKRRKYIWIICERSFLYKIISNYNHSHQFREWNFMYKNVTSGPSYMRDRWNVMYSSPCANQHKWDKKLSFPMIEGDK